MSTTVTHLLLPPTGFAELHGRVLNADATATTYHLQCPPKDSSCSDVDETITLGPWAEKTLARGAEPTGTMDLQLSYTSSYEPTAVGKTRAELVTWTYSLHCEMSRSVAQQCTVTQGPVKDISELRQSNYPAQTYTDKSGLAEIYGPTYAYAPITLTAGLEKLDGKHASSTESSMASATSDSAEESGTSASSTDSADAPGQTNDGVGRSVPSILALACVGLFILAF
ncbi:Ff.00g036660.m01.CDS01 [Fusarium sp. VM40]|nr:Ff.00g036660.m01.CDS01 [Fusarium sp. VM40]